MLKVLIQILNNVKILLPLGDPESDLGHEQTSFLCYNSRVIRDQSNDPSSTIPVMNKSFVSGLKNFSLRTPKLFSFIVFLLLSILLTYPLITSLGSPIIFDGDSTVGDTFIFLWNFWWAKKAIWELGINPLYCRYIFYPQGTSLVLATHTLVYGLLSIPIQLLFPKTGIALSANLIVLFSFVLSGWGVYLLCLEITENKKAAYFSGILFAFCGVRLLNLARFHILGTETLVFFVYFLWKMVRDGRWIWAVSASLCAVIAFYNSLEMFYFLGLWGLFYLIYTTITGENRNRWGQWGLTAGLGIILGLPLIFKIANAVSASLRTNMKINIRLRMFSLFLPSQLDSIYGSFLPYKMEVPFPQLYFSYFLGFVQISFIIFGIWKAGKDKKPWLWGAIIFYSFAIGNKFHFPFGITIPSPYTILSTFLPVIKMGRATVRITILVNLCCAILAGLGFSHWKYSKRTWLFFILFFLAIAECLDQFPLKTSPLSKMTADIPFYQKIKHDEEFSVLDIPPQLSSRLAMYLQTFHEKPLALACIPRLSANAARSFAELMDVIELLKRNRLTEKEVRNSREAFMKRKIKYIILHHVQDWHPNAYKNILHKNVSIYENGLKEVSHPIPSKLINLGSHSAEVFQVY